MLRIIATRVFLIGCVATGCASQQRSTAGVTGGAGVPLRGRITDMSQYHIENRPPPEGPTKVARPQPFQMMSAWARWRDGTSLVIIAYDRPVSAGEACGNDMPKGRQVMVETSWPLPPQSSYSTQPASRTGPHIMVGSAPFSGSRWEGEVRILGSDAGGGGLWMRAEDRYFQGITHRGHLDGDVSFRICPG